jgi:peptide chain release factor subunit 1
MSNIINDENLTAYIIIDSNGCLFGIVKGNEKTVLHRVLHSFTVEIPIKKKPHLEAYERQRNRKIVSYLQKVSDIATLLFLASHDIILAGPTDMKYHYRGVIH